MNTNLIPLNAQNIFEQIFSLLYKIVKIKLIENIVVGFFLDLYDLFKIS